MRPLFHNPGLVVADRWQRGFPLCTNPFAAVGSDHDLSEAETLSVLSGLQVNGMLSRIGAVVRPNRAGASTLAALACAPEEIDEIAPQVSAEPFVNHNYERQHAINLWFVVAAPSAHELTETLQRISRNTGREVLDLRLVRPYHIDLGFGLAGQDAKPCHADARRDATTEERALLAAIEDGLPLVPQPYAAVAEALGWTQARVLARLEAMVANGIVSRFGCVIHHRSVGFTANAMAVWDVPETEADAIGERLARPAGVTLCYRRNRWQPAWPYNLFAMIHGLSEDAVRRRIAAIADQAGLSAHPGAILFSRRCFKQRGARFAGPARQAA